MKTKCPHCKHLFEVEDEFKSKDVYCHSCKRSFEAESYLDEVAANLQKDAQEIPNPPLFEHSSSGIRSCGTFLVVGGVLCGIFLNGMAGLIAFIGGAIMIALGSILKRLEHIDQNIEKMHSETNSRKPDS